MQGSLMLDIGGTYLTAEDRHLLRQPQVCGVILFARNIEHPGQVRELCRAIREVRNDLLIAVDQEGGRVQRLRQGFVALPAMGLLQTAGNPEQVARECGWLMAWEVLAMGIDFSFAPVLDLDYGRSAVIGLRSFGGDVDTVNTLAGAFLQGMQAAGMPAVGKHFPGHGWVTADSHVAIPVDERSLADIQQADLIPFKHLQHALAGLMPAHVIYPQVDTAPAGFSKVWLQDILRQQLNYPGVLFSDDLSMAGAHVAGDAAQRLLAALNAGCNVGLICNDRGAAEQALSALQAENIAPCADLSAMYGRYISQHDFQQHPRWQSARHILKTLTSNG
ncbi:beta-N-acetylhexosaminidase [Pseudomonas sp. C27(2019)]|uniref:beta-N-acetylhexosaminidase n=1 Tax=Pseudomonas sp. C27(2019) TaxID=2604941 RepID=UPI00124920D9|nr:beta-N-acetylhexosaminidase [Pseudomonas sp. C27(2019)]QEY59031.1 beta-N-acetylhexosaminidase [Pseudomonas sp. C27(2019)]